jgi:very-short-patch-repair endonuclease
MKERVLSAPVATLLWQMKAVGISEDGLVLEYRFHPVRRWRFDACWPERMVALEVDGGGWVNGRHVSGTGFEADCLKMSEAAALGWRVMRVTPRMIDDGVAVKLLERALSTGESS